MVQPEPVQYEHEEVEAVLEVVSETARHAIGVGVGPRRSGLVGAKGGLLPGHALVVAEGGQRHRASEGRQVGELLEEEGAGRAERHLRLLPPSGRSR